MSKIKNISALTLATIIGGALNYAMYPIFLHHLSLEHFAQFSVYASIVSLFGIPAAGFGYYILTIAKQQEHLIYERKSYWMEVLLKFGVLYMIGGMVLLFLITPFLHIYYFSVIICIGILLVRSLSTAFFSSILQAKGQFVLLSLISVGIAFARFIASLGVIIVPDIVVAVATLLIAGLVSAYLMTRYGIRYFSYNTPIKDLPTPHQNNSLTAAITLIALIISLQTIDVIVMKYIFHDLDVALYAAISVITKFALIAISVLEGVFLPELLEEKKRQRNIKNFLLLFTLSIIGFITSYWLLPPIGEYIFTFLRPELTGSYMLFRYLGIASVAFGFFIIFAKSLQPTRYLLALFLCISLGILGFLWTAETVREFSWYYMIGMLSLYLIAVGCVSYRYFLHQSPR